MPESNDVLSDYQLTAADIGRIENHQQLIDLFAVLGYDVNDTVQVDHATLGLDSADLSQRIKEIRLVGTDPVDGDLGIYLFDVRSVTLDLRRRIARAFRDRPGDYLLVLTSDYEMLDFVLLERDVAKGQGLGKTLKQTIRPRSLTVSRRKPNPVHLRALKRFTFTEEDSLYQWDKLRAAYDLAEWSEPYFNNRALFSDYYLNERLPDLPQWQEDVAPIGRQVFGLMSGARSKLGGQEESVTRRELYEPLFDQLGLSWQEVKSGASSTEEPDYWLYDPEEPDGPIASVLTYVWDRSLDTEDVQRDPETPDEIPGAIVVSLLEKAQTPWVVVTNGRLWRLYSATADNKATNYYEIDLTEAISADDQLTALKYWWLFFRVEAFTGFLDDLLRGSHEYAKELGDRLKDRVFTAIFPHFARGFITTLREDGAAAADVDLDAVFQGTLTFLYRLIFVLYAESLDLLPLHEARGYGKNSLALLKREIAAVAGDVEDEAADNLRGHYHADSFELYERLLSLFRAIDTGDESWNLPSYNGGLFSEINEPGAFLAAARVPDQDLALGLDLLCRDLDDKTLALVFVDYKSLGVRQLGSIYEGLLEFKLRIAAEALAVIKEKGKEVYIPAAKAGKKRVYGQLEKGDIYLENDKRERKATGSYYTPDYIVKYIVEHTVGPVLDRKFEELAPRLREAEKQYQNHAKQVAARGGDQSPELFWKKKDMRQLADDCLDIRVLDPAMGSGHFLVEAVDYISNRLIDFLNAWSHNPVWAMLETIRTDILAGMAEQGVTIDPERLTRVVLLKRAVLKRCVYGVDLNPMAVELAKVSLWLDAFTLGAPLSFLDHHLKCGNSLIGARIDEVKEAVEGTADKAVQLSLFSGGAFTGLSLATDLMRQVSYRSDNTIAQVKESRDAYRDADDHLAYYKRVLDMYTSRWFGNEPPKKTDPAVEFIRNSDTREWLKEKEPAGDPPEAARFDAAQVAETALDAAQDKRFFHWELEFPEIFFGPSQPGGQDVQLREDSGFDAIVGNPPWEKIDANASEKRYLQETFAVIVEGEINFFTLFLYLPVKLVSLGNPSGLLVPYTWLINKYDAKLREALLDNFQLKELIYMCKNVFPDAPDAIPLIVLNEYRPTNARTEEVSVKVLNPNLLNLGNFLTEPMVDTNGDPMVWQSRELSQISVYDTAINHSVFEAMESNSKLLREYGWASDGIYKSTVEKHKSDQRNNPTDKPVIESASQTHRYIMKWGGAYIDKELWSSHEKLHIGEKLILHAARKPTMPIRIVVAYSEDEIYFSNRFIIVKPYQNNQVSSLYLLAIMNSSAINFYFKMRFPLTDVDAYMLHQLPIPKIDGISSMDRRTQAVQLFKVYEQNDFSSVLNSTQSFIDNGETGVVHDLLEALAQQMLDLNQRRLAEVDQFLNWLENHLKIRSNSNVIGGLNSLSGKTIIQNYFGDYQKGEPELPWDDFYYRLHQNRNRIGVNLEQVKGQIRTEYERSLAVLLPIKEQLAATDALIDQIVYQLYGLTEEKIALIEQPAYEQALVGAKAKVLGDKKLQKDTDAAVDAIAEAILPAARRFQARVPLTEDRASLDEALPGWHLLPDPVPTFLLTGEYNVRTQPDGLDFSTSVIPYTKAIEKTIVDHLLIPFRDDPATTASDGRHPKLQGFLEGKSPPALGEIKDILRSKKEIALRDHIRRRVPVADESIFGPHGVSELLSDEERLFKRNRAAHDTVLTRADAEEIRNWALTILRHL